MSGARSPSVSSCTAALGHEGGKYVIIIIIFCYYVWLFTYDIIILFSLHRSTHNEMEKNRYVKEEMCVFVSFEYWNIRSHHQNYFTFDHNEWVVLGKCDFSHVGSVGVIVK